MIKPNLFPTPVWALQIETIKYYEEMYTYIKIIKKKIKLE